MRLLTVLSLFIVWGCRTPPAELTETLDWSTYEEPHLFSIKVPAASNVWRSNNPLFVKIVHEGRTIAKVHWISEAEGQGRGLWFEHSAEGDQALDGLAGKQFRYTHSDGPFFARIRSFVVPFKDRYFALEFVVDHDLTPLQREMLESIRFLP